MIKMLLRNFLSSVCTYGVLSQVLSGCGRTYFAIHGGSVVPPQLLRDTNNRRIPAVIWVGIKYKSSVLLNFVETREKLQARTSVMA